MKLMIPLLSEPIRFNEGIFRSLVIENQRFYREVLTDIDNQINGKKGNIVFSENDIPLPMIGHVILVDDFLRLTPNQKPLLSKLQSIMEKESLAPEYYDATMTLLAAIENHLQHLSSSLSLEPACDKLTPAALVRMAGIRFHEDSPSPGDAIFDYMTLVRDLEGDRLFLFAGLRSWLTDEEIQTFTQTALIHQFRFLLIDGSDHPRLVNEMRITIDRDLCVF